MDNSPCVFTREFLKSVLDKKLNPESYIEYDNQDLKEKQRAIIKFEKNLINDVNKTLRDDNFIVTLKEIFNWDDEFIKLILSVFGDKPLEPKKNKILVALALNQFIVDKDRKYLTSPGLFSIFMTIPTFEEALTVFDFSSSPFIERFINIDSNIGFCPPIGVDKEFENTPPEKKDILIYFASLINKAVRKKCDGKITIRNGFTMRLIKLIGLLHLDIVYDRVMFFISLINNSKFDLKKEGFANGDSLPSFGNFITTSLILDFEIILQILYIEPLTLSTILGGSNKTICRNLVPIARHIDNLPIKIKQWFIDKCSIVGDHFALVAMIKIFIKSKYYHIFNYNTLNYTYTILSTADKICNINNNDLIEYIVDISSHENIEKFDISLCLMITSLFVLDRQSSYLNLEFLRLFRGINNGELHVILRHIQSVDIDIRDNFLYTRLARWFLMKKFVRSTPNEMLALNCKDSIFKVINSNRLIRQDLAQYYNLTIDVHDKGRDRDTRTACRALLKLNEYGEFVKPIDTSITCPNDLITDLSKQELEEPEDPFSNLDREVGNTIDEYTGELDKDKIVELVKEVFEHARLNLSYDESLKFFRAIGYDYDMVIVSRKEDDFKGFLREQINLDIRFFDSKLVLAYLWRYAKTHHEDLRDSLIGALVNSIQKKLKKNEDGSTREIEYSVCNDGKLQNMVVAVLQGRLILPSGELVIIDKIKEEKKKKETRKYDPAQIFHEIKPYIDYITASTCRSSNEFFKGLFQYAFGNNLSEYMFEIVEAVSIYAEDIHGFNINHELSIANCYEGMFDTTDYILATSQIVEMGNNVANLEERFNNQERGRRIYHEYEDNDDESDEDNFEEVD